MATTKEKGIEQAEPASPKSPPPDDNNQEGSEKASTSPPPHSDADKDDSEWFDVMIVGHTGQGKSTTADKIILACYPKSSPSTKMLVDAKKADCQPSTEIFMEDNGVTSPEEDEDSGKKVRNVDYRASYRHKDFAVWTGTFSDKEREFVEYLETSSRSIECHLEVNKYRKKQEGSSMCQLISNNVTKTRVLDVPGFFTVEDPVIKKNSTITCGDSATPSSIEKESAECTQDHLSMMRDIIRMQYIMKIKFNRILYFLPVRGPLERSDRILRQELLTLARYFGRSIFDVMVIVATAPSRLSEMLPMKNLLFTEEDKEMTKEKFYNALKEVLHIVDPKPSAIHEAVPKPPAKKGVQHISGDEDEGVPKLPATGDEDEVVPKPPATGDEDEVVPKPPATGDEDEVVPKPPATGDEDEVVPKPPATGDEDEVVPKPPATGDEDEVVPKPPATGDEDEVVPKPPATGDEDEVVPKPPAIEHIVDDEDDQGVPNPPVLFISLSDNCEDIVHLVKGTEVVGDPLELSFDRSTCARCSSSIRQIEREMILCLPSSSNAKVKSDTIHYGQSQCHPLLVPKGSELEDIEVVDGVVCIVLKKDVNGQYDEVCHKCGKSSGMDGCMPVGSSYEIETKSKKLPIRVDHTNWIEKHRKLSYSDIAVADEADKPED